MARTGPCLLFFAAASVGLFAQQPDVAALERRFDEGRRAIVENRYAEAVRALEAARELGPDIAEVHAALGFAYFQQGRFEEVPPTLKTALHLKPGLPNLDVLIAASLSEMGRFEEAAPALEHAFASLSDRDLKRLAGLHLMRCLAGLGRDQEAAETALAMTKLHPEDPEVLYHAGRLFGNFAFLTVQKLSQTAPDSIWARQAAGEAYEADGQFERAVAAYRDVLEMDSHRRGIRFRLGRALLRASREPEAVEQAMLEFKAELQSDPTNANAAYELGEIHRTRGDLEEARRYFLRAVESYPDFEQAQLALGGVLTGMGKPSLAVAHLTTAIDLNPNNDVLYYRLAQAYRALGKTEEMQEALATFRRLRAERSQGTAAGASNEPVTAQRVDPE